MRPRSKERVALQNDYCKINKVPLVCPIDGICFFCKKDLFERITEADARESYITGCCFCKRSFIS